MLGKVYASSAFGRSMLKYQQVGSAAAMGRNRRKRRGRPQQGVASAHAHAQADKGCVTPTPEWRIEPPPGSVGSAADGRKVCTREH